MRIANPGPFGRVLVVAVALFANFFAAGVPVLHALAHERHAHVHDGDHHEAPEPAGLSTEVEHSHDEVHPDALHDDGQVLPRALVDLEGIVRPEPFAPLCVVNSSERSPGPEVILLSRGPPGGGAPRAPPLH